jgi:hypothetical protein
MVIGVVDRVGNDAGEQPGARGAHAVSWQRQDVHQRRHQELPGVLLGAREVEREGLLVLQRVGQFLRQLEFLWRVDVASYFVFHNEQLIGL